MSDIWKVTWNDWQLKEPMTDFVIADDEEGAKSFPHRGSTNIQVEKLVPAQRLAESKLTCDRAVLAEREACARLIEVDAKTRRPKGETNNEGVLRRKRARRYAALIRGRLT